MLGRFSLEDLRIEIVDINHDFSSFVSNDLDLLAFLRRDALNHFSKKLSITFLFFHVGLLVSYVTLLNDKIKLEGDLKKFFRKKGVMYPSLPALKIGRLCVHDDFQRRGLGKFMLAFAEKRARQISRYESGCRFLTVDSKPDALGFYKKFGFVVLNTRKDGSATLFFDLSFA